MMILRNCRSDTVFLLVLIPTGSIYIMNNIFMLGFANNNGRTRINSTFTVLIFTWYEHIDILCLYEVG